MDPQISFTPEEKLALERVLAMQSRRAKYTKTLSYLMDKWSRIVLNVEKEYRLTIDDYTNDLSLRNLVQEVLDACPENAGLREWTSEWDKRFEKATVKVKEPLLPERGNKKKGWWWFRIPINQGSELKKWFQLTEQE